MTRRRFRPITTGANPTLESLTRRQSSRRIFRELQGGKTRSATPVWIPYQRRIQCLGPLLSDSTIPGHTHDWLFGKYYGFAFNEHFLSWPDFWFYVNPSNTPGSNTFPGEFLLRPIRFRLTGWAPMSATSTYGVQMSNDNLFSGAMPNTLQNSGLTPPATSDGHFSGSRTSGVFITRGILSGNIQSRPSTIVAARVRIDGADVSGVQTMNVPMQTSTGLYTGYGPNESRALTIPLTSTVTVSDAEEVTIDLWIKFKVTASESTRDSFDAGQQYVNNQPVTAAWNWWAPMIAALGTHPMPRPTNPFHATAIPVATVGEVNVHRRIGPSDTWALTFAGTTFAGLSSLVLQPQSGWTYIRNQTQIIMSKPSGIPFARNWRIVFSYGSECPELQVITPTGPHTAGLRYHVLSPSYFAEHSRFNFAHGPVTRSGTNTFYPSLFSNPSTSTPPWLPVAQLPGGTFPDFPASISVVRS